MQSGITDGLSDLDKLFKVKQLIENSESKIRRFINPKDWDNLVVLKEGCTL